MKKKRGGKQRKNLDIILYLKSLKINGSDTNAFLLLFLLLLMSHKTYCGWKMCVSEHSRIGSGSADLILCPVHRAQHQTKTCHSCSRFHLDQEIISCAFLTIDLIPLIQLVGCLADSKGLLMHSAFILDFITFSLGFLIGPQQAGKGPGDPPP